MPRINTTASGHVGPAPVAGVQWLPFTNHAYELRLRHAMGIIDTRVKGYAPCNAAFHALPGGRTFAAVWADPAVWISYEPSNVALNFAGTLGNEVAITQYTCRMGLWTIVATVIHELAHVNGADGLGHDAEQTLTSCLMRAHHNPHLNGQLEYSTKRSPLVAFNRARSGPRGA